MLFRSAALAAMVSAFGHAASAHAAPCSDLDHPVYVSAASGSAPLMRWTSAQLGTAGAELDIVFITTTTCVAIDAITNGTPATGNGTFWLADGTPQTCQLPSPAGQVVDVALAGVSAALCADAPNPLPATIGDFLGPISSLSYVVHHLSTETSISAEAIHAIFSLGGAAGVAPWTDDNYIFHRDITASTQLWTQIAADLDSPTGWFGGDTVTSTAMVTAVGGTGNESKRFGFVTTEIADANTGSVKALAYQHTGQTCGYWPDSTSSARDKINVRNGQYFIWGPIHFYAELDGGDFVSDRAQQLIELIRGTTPPPAGVSFLDATIRAGNVPDCAMQVMRTTDLGPMASYAPENPCGCYFESEAAGGTSCTPCTDTCPNSGEVCRFGYCEAY